ncbi:MULTISPECIES: dienelactone hydrolase family protein [unclassified Spirosoma]|uniref:dienelactone hydrolase family protein n=1 Tax=unclassified Spirosoma TaxID=2621999 RepID=UPI00095EE4DE|nr:MULTISPECIES: dienelactone hydrolase family protein [unclassified Spirosoma]MBN8823971.1 dienelactone hydrolase family protein [Spirosoma sp.]OJW70382.1 MAG: dienelactone hydrolase [Spirosoma sp. 48-14]
MKIIFITGLSFFMSLFSYLAPVQEKEQKTIPLCHNTDSATPNDMALMAADPAFQNLHTNPLPFTYAGAGEMIKFSTPDGQPANGFFLKSKKASNKWLLVYQEWWGLNDNIKQQAEAFYNDLKDVNVLAVDMYDGKVATERAEAGKLMSSASKERLTSIQKGAIAYAGPKAEFASVGWCFGGMLSLQSALMEGQQAKGCVMYYGRPEQDVEKLKTLNTDVLGIFGSRDKGITPESVKQFEENMQKAGKKVTVKMYDADHGFANPSNPIYDKEAAADAYKLSLAYLKDKLKA